jgi:hypothetical protein
LSQRRWAKSSYLEQGRAESAEHNEAAFNKVQQSWLKLSSAELSSAKQSEAALSKVQQS